MDALIYGSITAAWGVAIQQFVPAEAQIAVACLVLATFAAAALLRPNANGGGLSVAVEPPPDVRRPYPTYDARRRAGGRIARCDGAAAPPRPRIEGRRRSRGRARLRGVGRGAAAGRDVAIPRAIERAGRTKIVRRSVESRRRRTHRTRKRL